MRRLFVCVCVALVLLCSVVWAENVPSPVPTPVPGAQYRVLKQGMSGTDVILLRLRMYQLGYFASDHVYNQYTNNLAQKIKQLQAANSLEETGIATPELQLLIFSPACKSLPGAVSPTPNPTLTPAPIISPTAAPDLPALDAEGFLPQGSTEEFVYISAEEGLWYYISDSLYVEIKQFSQTGRNKLLWYEAKVNLRNGLLPKSFSEPYEKLTADTFVSPEKIARENRVVLGISDDTYTWRTFYNRRTGIVIRNGVLLHHTPYTNKASFRFPNLDVMAFLPDGSMAVYDNGEVTPEYLLSLGVKDAYSFGPILLRDGEESLLVRYFAEHSTEIHPRCAIGMIKPNQYVLLMVTGRTVYSDGCTLPWLSERMKALGAVQAFNLDGGGSATITFMGSTLNKESEKNIRLISDIIGFGTSELVEKN